MAVFLIATFLALSVRASVIPTAPGPGEIYPIGGVCPIKWNPSAIADPAWSTFTIDLMSGTDSLQNVVVTAATGKNGNDPDLNEFTWPCPAVDTAAPIYFYRFTPTGPGGDPDAAQYTTRFTISRANGSIEPSEHPLQPNGDPIPWGIGHLQSETNSLSANSQGIKATHRLPPHIPSSLRIAATSTILHPVPTILNQQEHEVSTEEGENDDTTSDDIGEILASMSRADALRLLPTAMKDGQTATLAAPSQSVFPVVDSEANNTTTDSRANDASSGGISLSTFPLFIVSLVVLCIEVAS